MTTTNPFGLLDDDSEDINLLVKAKPLKVEKTDPVQPGQAVTEAKNGSVGGRRGGRRDGGGFNRGRDGGGYNRDSRNSGAPANGNGGYRRSEEGDGARRGGHVGGNRRGVFSNGDSGDFERPRRNFDRHSGTGHGNEFKRDGDGRRNRRETTEDETPPVNGESATVVEKDLPVGGEGEATDANEEKPVKVRVEKEPEIKLFTLEEYEKVLEEKKKALQATKVEERKVDTKAFDSMQQLSSKKSSNDDVFIKLGTEKDKRTVEREEKIKKSLSINEFLKPAKGERYRGGHSGGRGGRGPREGGDQRNGDQRNGGGNQKNGEIAAPKIPAPKIEDTAQFPTLGK